MMRVVLATLMLLALSGCGGEENADPPSAARASAAPTTTTPSPAAAEPTEASNQETCDKLARAWAVKAEKLLGPLYLALPEKASTLTSAMTDATDQMDIEACDGPAVALALRANYEASVVSAQLLTCDQSDLSAALDCGEKIGKRWERKGMPLLVQVRNLVG